MNTTQHLFPGLERPAQGVHHLAELPPTVGQQRHEAAFALARQFARGLLRRLHGRSQPSVEAGETVGQAGDGLLGLGAGGIHLTAPDRQHLAAQVVQTLDTERRRRNLRQGPGLGMCRRGIDGRAFHAGRPEATGHTGNEHGTGPGQRVFARGDQCQQAGTQQGHAHGHGDNPPAGSVGFTMQHCGDSSRWRPVPARSSGPAAVPTVAETPGICRKTSRPPGSG